jgi:8-oxo-dGTP diphosphatase
MPHIHEKYDFTIAAFLVFKDKVLLVNHPRYGKWMAPGGHIELDEDPDEALFREVKEETGFDDIEVLSSKPTLKERKVLFTPNYVDVHDANPPHKHISLIYFARVKHDQHIKSDEHTEARWLTVEELENPNNNIPADIIFYAKEAIKLAQNS